MYRKILIFLAVFCIACPVTAQDAKPEEAKVPKLEDAKTFEEIESYMESLGKKMQADIQALAQKGEITIEVVGPFLQTMAEQTVAAGEKMVEIGKDDEQKTAGYEVVIQGLKQLVQREKLQHVEKLKKEQGLTAEDEQDREKMMPLLLKVEEFETEAQKRLDALFDKLEKDEKFAETVLRERYQQFVQTAGKVYAGFSLEKFEKFKKEAMEWANRKIEGVDTTRPLSTVLQLAGMDKAVQADPKLAEKTLDELIAFVKSDACKLSDEEKAELTMQFEGSRKRAVGAELNLYGKTLDDKDFDWKTLRGKYVLVKFTASWCGPCKAEIPGMKKLYEKYKDKGFEIVSVYVWDELDDSKKAVEEEKLPWLIVSEALTEKAGQPPQGKNYAIQGVPTMLLIDKEGKVLTDSARSAALEEKLAELLDK